MWLPGDAPLLTRTCHLRRVVTPPFSVSYLLDSLEPHRSPTAEIAPNLDVDQNTNPHCFKWKALRRPKSRRIQSWRSSGRTAASEEESCVILLSFQASTRPLTCAFVVETGLKITNFAEVFPTSCTRLRPISYSKLSRMQTITLTPMELGRASNWSCIRGTGRSICAPIAMKSALPPSSSTLYVWLDRARRGLWTDEEATSGRRASASSRCSR